MRLWLQARRREQGGADDVAEAEGGEGAGKDKKAPQWTLDGDSDDELHGMADEDEDAAKQQGEHTAHVFCLRVWH